MSNLAYTAVTALFAFCAAAIGWHFKGKKLSADAQGVGLDNVKKAIEIWQELSEDLKAQNKELQEKVDKLTQTVLWLEGEQKTLINENRMLHEQIAHFETILAKNQL